MRCLQLQSILISQRVNKLYGVVTRSEGWPDFRACSERPPRILCLDAAGERTPYRSVYAMELRIDPHAAGSIHVVTCLRSLLLNWLTFNNFATVNEIFGLLPVFLVKFELIEDYFSVSIVWERLQWAGCEFRKPCSTQPWQFRNNGISTDAAHMHALPARVYVRCMSCARLRNQPMPRKQFTRWLAFRGVTKHCERYYYNSRFDNCHITTDW